MKEKLSSRAAGKILLFLVVMSVFNACWDEHVVSEGDYIRPENSVTLGRGVYGSDYQVAQVVAGATWKYIISKGSNKNPGHFIIDFGRCGDQGATINNIVSVTVNGEDWSNNISGSEGKTGCEMNTTNFVKFDNLHDADEHVIEFTLDTLYAEVITSAWIKSGRSCFSKEVIGPGCRGYRLTSTMEANASLAGRPHTEINTYMKTFGFDYTEHPYCSSGYGGHAEAVHANIVQDVILNKSVFGFDIHINPVIDGDRCSSTVVDRQRNEMKSVTNNTTWAKVLGNWNEWQMLEWKFKLPQGFQPTANFCHIHQLKAQDGPNNGNPVITITPRANTDGSNKRMQIIHTIDGASTDKGTVVNNIPLSEFEGEWVQVREQMHYTHNGYYSCKITRVRDGKILIDFHDSNIDLWPSGTSYVRHKYGLYRSLAGGRLDRVPVGQSPLLKNESILVTDFRVYEKNTNVSPGTPHE
jgi:hypothetical protein